MPVEIVFEIATTVIAESDDVSGTRI